MNSGEWSTLLCLLHTLSPCAPNNSPLCMCPEESSDVRMFGCSNVWMCRMFGWHIGQSKATDREREREWGCNSVLLKRPNNCGRWDNEDDDDAKRSGSVRFTIYWMKWIEWCVRVAGYLKEESYYSTRVTTIEWHSVGKLTFTMEILASDVSNMFWFELNRNVYEMTNNIFGFAKWIS